MNREWVRAKLESFKKLCEEYEVEHDKGGYTRRQRQLNDDMNDAMPTVKEILKRLDPALVDEIGQPDSLRGARGSLQAVQQALGILRDRDEWTTNLAPDAPSLVADEFHPHVWSPAAELWETGQYRVAVGQAATALSAHISSKASSPLTERRLAAEVFSSKDPNVGQVRLHLPGDKATDTWRSRQDGLHLLAQGAFAGIRNVAAHTDEEWPEQVALEHLAVLSVVARWADETVVTRT